MTLVSHGPALTVERVRTRAEFLALEGEWNALAASSPNPLLRHEWFAACLESYAAQDSFVIYLARGNGGLRAAAPLVVQRSGPIARLRLLGWQSMEPEAFLYDDRGALEAVCRAVLASGRPVALGRLDAASPELELLSTLSKGRGVRVLRTASTRTHATRVPADAPAVEASMAAKKRSEIRRLRTQLERQGPVRFEMTEPRGSEVDAAFAELLRVEAASWKGRAATALTADARQQSLLRLYARAVAEAGMLRVSTLRVGEQTIAVQMDVECGGRLWGLKMGADDAWSKYAPGILSTHELIRWAAGRGLEFCEHLGAAEAWQTRWPYELREQSAFRFYPPRPGAAVALGLDVIDFAQRRRKDRSADRLARRRAHANGTGKPDVASGTELAGGADPPAEPPA